MQLRNTSEAQFVHKMICRNLFSKQLVTEMTEEMLWSFNEEHIVVFNVSNMNYHHRTNCRK